MEERLRETGRDAPIKRNQYEAERGLSYWSDIDKSGKDRTRDTDRQVGLW